VYGEGATGVSGSGSVGVNAEGGITGLSAKGNTTGLEAESSTAFSGVGAYVVAKGANSTGIFVDGRGTDVGAYGADIKGRTRIQGNFQVVGVKSFAVDHPLDPANRYLFHFAQEGPEVQNVYNGVVLIGGDCRAEVQLPDYFLAANAGPFRYQLTAIGAAMPNLHIAEEIENNRFVIAGGVPGKRVSWEVTAVRDDPSARFYRVDAEQDKLPEERGTYLHPRAWGVSEELSYDRKRYGAIREMRERRAAEPGEAEMRRRDPVSP
jgi:hypothetical protein